MYIEERINKIVLEIIQSKEELFYIDKSAYSGNLYLGCKQHGLLNLFSGGIVDNIELSLPIFNFNPYVKLLIKKSNERVDAKIVLINLYYPLNNSWEDTIKVLNEFIDSIRSEAETKEFKKIVNNYQRLPEMNYKSLVKFIDKLFKGHPRLLVLRIGLFYKKYRPFFKENEINEKYRQAKKDFKQLLNDLRSNKLFKHKFIYGYVWKLEYVIEVGFHYHMFFFLDGSEDCVDSNICRLIGECWENVITLGKGQYRNWNDEKDKRRYLGMINYNDTVLMAELKKAAEILTKTSNYTRINTPDEGRTFGKGEIKP